MNSKQSHLVEEEASARFKQQRLLEDYLEVQKVILHSLNLVISMVCFALNSIIWVSDSLNFFGHAFW